MIALHKISGLNDNGSIPLQRQQDEQPEGANISGNAIDDNDVVDIMTLYPPWSPDTNDRCDVILPRLLMTRAQKKYKMNFTKIHQSKLKLISPT